MVRRRNYFIKKTFQINFLTRFIALLLLGALLIAGLFMYVSNSTLTTGYSDSALRIERTPNFFFVSLVIIVLVVVVGVSLAGLAIFILLSHRIAGPLYRFEKALRQLEGGDFTTRINLRKTDQLTELKEALNAFADTLDKRLGAVKNSVAELEKALSRKDDPGIKEKLEKELAHLKDGIDYFKVTSTFKE